MHGSAVHSNILLSIQADVLKPVNQVPVVSERHIRCPHVVQGGEKTTFPDERHEALDLAINGFRAGDDGFLPDVACQKQAPAEPASQVRGIHSGPSLRGATCS